MLLSSPIGRQHGCRKIGLLRLRADRRRRPPGPPPGAIPAAKDISGSRSVRCAQDPLAATTWSAASRDRPSPTAAHPTPKKRQRAQRSHDHHRGLLARFRGQASSLSRGASNTPRHALLQPSSGPPAPAERRPEAARHAHGGDGSPIDLELDGDGVRPSDLRRLVVGRQERTTRWRRRRSDGMANYWSHSAASTEGPAITHRAQEMVEMGKMRDQDRSDSGRSDDT